MDFGQIINALIMVHPWHSLAVHFPIGLTGAALLFVVLALWRRSEWLEHAAYFTLAMAGVTAILAGLTGLRDNIVRYDGSAPLVSQKIFLALTLLVLATVTVVSRRRRRDLLWQPSTMVLYVAGFAGCFGLAAILGFLGGTILYGL
jgi:uncharacterized membrane protein